MEKILIIQTAFIGDVVLATALIEKLHAHFPGSKIDFLVRKGNESLLLNNLKLNNVLVWDKKKNKTRNLFRLLKSIRKTRYDKIINVHRYISTGILTAFSGAKEKIGFDKNPLSFLFTKKIKHEFDPAHIRHEVERNNDLIKDFTDESFTRPVLYPSREDEALVEQYKQRPYITLTPSSVWFTKRYPIEKWIELIERMDPSIPVYLLGGKENIEECEYIRSAAVNKNTFTLAGKLSFLQSTALMKGAIMNYTNDSAPLHFASAVNAPVTAIFCSTVPAFGYTPLSDISYIVETHIKLLCKPCGFHGRKSCPMGHFKCALTIETEQLLEKLVIK